MHGELLEFTDFLQRQLRVKDAFIEHLKQQLIHIRGPVLNLDVLYIWCNNGPMIS